MTLDERIEEQQELVARLRRETQAPGARESAREDWRYEAGLLEGLRIARRMKWDDEVRRAQ